jgi:hypothetical protein
VRRAYQVLVEDNARKAIGAEIELVLRARYYGDEWLNPQRTESLVRDLQAHLLSLDDGHFFLKHNARLLPAKAQDVRGAAVGEAVASYKALLAEERAAAMAVLVKALGGIYPDRERHEVEALAELVGAGLPHHDNLRAMAADAAEIFPAEFGAVKVKKVLAAYRESKKEKGL